VYTPLGVETVENVREEFSTWLSNENWRWTTYATLTFARPMRKDALRFARAWVRFIARTATEVWGFCFQETHSDGQRLHVHCLLSVRRNLIAQPSNEEMWSWWFQKFGRAQVVDYKGIHWKELAASLTTHRNHSEIVERYITPLAGYLTKYMVKEAFQDGFDWDFYAFSCGKELTSDQFKSYLGVDPTFLAEGVTDGILQ